MAKEISQDGWIAHDGGDNPGLGAVEVELRFRDGLTTDGHAYSANIIGWRHIGERDDIIAYRVVQS